MTNSIILYGPARSGKTLNADAIAEHYGCTGIIDEWDRDQPMADGTLHITRRDFSKARMIMQNFETGKGHEVQCVSIAEALEAVGATFTAEPVKPSYHAQSKALLTEAHGTASGALEGKMYQRERLIDELVKVDQQIVYLSNRRSDLATGIARLEGLANTFMPTDSVTVEPSDPYVPNPFAGEQPEDSREFPEATWLEFEAMEQLHDIRTIDGDCTLVAMRRNDLLAMIEDLKGEQL